MNKTRLESYTDKINKISKVCISNDDMIVELLSEIAGSLAVIADCMTAKKDGDME